MTKQDIPAPVTITLEGRTEQVVMRARGTVTVERYADGSFVIRGYAREAK